MSEATGVSTVFVLIGFLAIVCVFAGSDIRDYIVQKINNHYLNKLKFSGYQFNCLKCKGQVIETCRPEPVLLLDNKHQNLGYLCSKCTGVHE